MYECGGVGARQVCICMWMCGRIGRVFVSISTCPLDQDPNDGDHTGINSRRVTQLPRPPGPMSIPHNSVNEYSNVIFEAEGDDLRGDAQRQVRVASRRHRLDRMAHQLRSGEMAGKSALMTSVIMSAALKIMSANESFETSRSATCGKPLFRGRRGRTVQNGRRRR